MDTDGQAREHVNLPCDPGRSLKLIEPDRASGVKSPLDRLTERLRMLAASATVADRRFHESHKREGDSRTLAASATRDVRA